VFRANPTPISPPKDGPEGPYLCPPETGKNFLISPPGSPPVGWEQTVEDPPNSTPLADDLIIALKRLQLLDRRAPSGPELLLEGDEHAGITVYVEDCDGGRDGGKEEEAEEWVYGETMGARDAYKPSATARPPVPLAA
jgi:calcipressin-2